MIIVAKMLVMKITLGAVVLARIVIILVITLGVLGRQTDLQLTLEPAQTVV